MGGISIEYNARERIQILFPVVTPPAYQLIAWRKYSFGFNFNIDQTKTYQIDWYYPNEISAQTEVVNGVVYALWDILSSLMVTIAKRGGGYYCIDAPLCIFMHNDTGAKGHYNLELNDWEIDTTNSYIKCSQTISLPFNNPALFELYFSIRPK